jgi:hypothetical protein
MGCLYDQMVETNPWKLTAGKFEPGPAKTDLTQCINYLENTKPELTYYSDFSNKKSSKIGLDNPMRKIKFVPPDKRFVRASAINSIVNSSSTSSKFIDYLAKKSSNQNSPRPNCVAILDELKDSIPARLSTQDFGKELELMARPYVPTNKPKKQKKTNVFSSGKAL